MLSGFIAAAGGLGLFLLGMVTMTDGLKSLAEDSLRRVLARFTKSPVSGAITGAATTAVVQSSSATTVTAVGFVGAGLLTFSQALGVIFGANIGTTITGWFVAIVGFKLKIGEFALPLILLGVLMRLFLKRRAASAGVAIAGFGLVFVGINALQSGMEGLGDVVTPDTFPEDTITGRLILVLIGVVITLVTQSSSAGVATALAAVHAGTITFPQAAAMVIGMDVGTTATAAIATIGGSTDARRTGYAHVIYNMMTGIGAFLILSPFVWCWGAAFGAESIQGQPEIALVAFHTTFNTLGVLAVLPFTSPFASFIIRLVPERERPHTEHLDRRLYQSPAVAIEAVRATLTDVSVAVFQRLGELLHGRGPDDEDLALFDADEALKRTREFVEPVDTSTSHETLYPKHLSVIHAIDHLRRLIDRCEETDRAERASDEADLSGLGSELQTAVRDAVTELADRDQGIPTDRWKQLWREFEDHAERYRDELIETAVAGDADAFTTIGKLDTLRWLRRVAYHLWRIMHHLRRSQIDEGIDEPEDIPPHQEQELD